MSHLNEILAKAGELPPFPAVFHQVMALTADPVVGADKILGVVEFDQAITARIIRMCNLTIPGGGAPVATLRDALARTGDRRLLQVVISAAGTDLLDRELPGYNLAGGELWKHSMMCALLAESLCDIVNYPSPARAFAAGLIHDVGKLAMSESVAGSYVAIREAIESGGISFLEAETRVLGVNHAEIGGRLGEMWHFDPEMVDALRFHHAPAGATCGTRLPFLVHLSDILCLISGLGVGADGLRYKVDYDLCKANGIGPREFEMAVIRLSEVEAQFHGIAAMFEREG
ncbi:MAG TPA: HDOD domain-containing protein [Candidatus Deferrimicrobiaceae bacterium]